MELIILVSILLITVIVWFLRKLLLIKVCPICIGVSLTWLWMFFGMFLGKLPIDIYQLPTALLMGGTVVGIMSKLEQFIKPNFILFWKTLFIVFGFSSFYGLLVGQFLIFGISAFLAIIMTFIFKIYKNGAEKEKSENIKEVEDRMKNCC